MSRIGELLVREKMLSLGQLQKAQDEAKRTGKRLGTTLSKMGFVQDQDLQAFVAKQYSLPSINLNEIEIDPSVLKLVSREICEKHQVIPVRRNGPTLVVAMADPSNIYAIDELKFLTQYNIEPVVASEASIEANLSKYFDKGPDLDSMMEGFDVDSVDYAATAPLRKFGKVRCCFEQGTVDQFAGEERDAPDPKKHVDAVRAAIGQHHQVLEKSVVIVPQRQVQPAVPGDSFGNCQKLSVALDGDAPAGRIFGGDFP